MNQFFISLAFMGVFSWMSPMQTSDKENGNLSDLGTVRVLGWLMYLFMEQADL